MQYTKCAIPRADLHPHSPPASTPASCHGRKILIILVHVRVSWVQNPQQRDMLSILKDRRFQIPSLTSPLPPCGYVVRERSDFQSPAVQVLVRQRTYDSYAKAVSRTNGTTPSLVPFTRIATCARIRTIMNRMNQAWFRHFQFFDLKISLIFPLGVFTQNIGTQFVVLA